MSELNYKCPIVEGVPFRYSVGFYRIGSKRRRVIAWFCDKDAANHYLARCVASQKPGCFYDLSVTLF